MEIAQLILEYLRVLIWPLIVICLAVSQKETISRLISNIKKVNFPGGSAETGTYPELPKEKDEQELLPIPDKDSTDKRIDKLDREFNKFLLWDLQSNKRIIANLMDALWTKFGFRLMSGGKVPVEFADQLEPLGERIDPKALDDLKYVEAIMKKRPPSREELMRAYLKSKVLVGYFRGLTTRR
jgi:hypothetical protein